MRAVPTTVRPDRRPTRHRFVHRHPMLHHLGLLLLTVVAVLAGALYSHHAWGCTVPNAMVGEWEAVAPHAPVRVIAWTHTEQGTVLNTVPDQALTPGRSTNGQARCVLDSPQTGKRYTQQRVGDALILRDAHGHRTTYRLAP